MRRLALLCGLLLVCGALQAADPPELLTEAGADSNAVLRARSAMWRSMLLPGWGQAYNHEWIKSLAIAGSELGLLYGARRQHRNWQDWKDRRELAWQGEDLVYREFASFREDFYLNDRNKLLWWWLWLRLASVLDAYVGGHLSNYQGTLNFNLRPDPPVAGEPLRLRLTLPLGR